MTDWNPLHDAAVAVLKRERALGELTGVLQTWHAHGWLCPKRAGRITAHATAELPQALGDASRSGRHPGRANYTAGI